MKNRGLVYLTVVTTFAASFVWQHTMSAHAEGNPPKVASPAPVQQKSDAATAIRERVQSIEYRASRSRRANDLSGFAPSLYRGEWYSKKAEAARRCIMYRESRFHYTSKNRHSSASGAYQFLDSQWRHGLVAMMVKESKQTQDGLAAEAKALINLPITKWSRYWQDRAFYTAWRFGEGASHWALTHGTC